MVWWVLIRLTQAAVAVAIVVVDVAEVADGEAIAALMIGALAAATVFGWLYERSLDAQKPPRP